MGGGVVRVTRVCCVLCRVSGRCVKCRWVKPASPAGRGELRGRVGIPALAAALRGLVITNPTTRWSWVCCCKEEGTRWLHGVVVATGVGMALSEGST